MCNISPNVEKNIEQYISLKKHDTMKNKGQIFVHDKY